MDSNRTETTLSPAHLALLTTLIFTLAPLKVLFCTGLFSVLYVFFTLTQTEVKIFAMEHKAAELLGVLKNPNLSIDTKVAHLTGLKSDIKQKNVPEGAVPSIFECLRVSIGSQHQSLLSAGFSTLGHFIKRLSIQEQDNLISAQSSSLYPTLLDRLGDHKERIRAQAAQAFTDLWPTSSEEVEHNVLDVALVGKNPKAKEMSMIWLSNMTKMHGLLFRSYVPSLVACLEDADSTVRDTAKLIVVELFQNAPARAKADLQRQLSIHNVRKSISNAILASIELPTDMDTPVLHQSSIYRADSQPPRPPSRGDALIQRSASRADVLPTRPPSRGDALIQRSASRADVLPTRPPSRGDALIKRPVPTRPPSRGDALIQRPIPVRPPSCGETLHQSARPPSRGDALHQPLLSVLPTSANTQVDIHAASEGEHISSKIDSTHSRTETAKAGQERTVAALPDSGTQIYNSQASNPSTEEVDKVEPLFVNSSREIDNIVNEVLPFFEGKESEDNWLKREKSVNRLRRLTHGNAPRAYSQQYTSAIKTLLDGIFKVANSLRTTLSTAGLLLVQDLARICGPKIDPMVEIIMQNLVKLCGGMKKITAANGKATVNVVLENVTYTPRLLQHVSSAALDRNAQLRNCGTGWLQTLMKRQAHHKSSIEHGGGLDTIEKCIKKGISDANSEVREAVRSTFWTFYQVWPDRANAILSNLENKQRAILEKHPSNPNADPAILTTSVSSKKGSATGAVGASSRSALKAAIAAQKKASLSPSKITPRPGSAQSAFIGTKSSTDISTSTRTVVSSSNVSSLSSAPLRPSAKAKRPELNRPATADPYAARRYAAPSRIEGSPRASKLHPSTPSKTRKAKISNTSSPAKSKPKRLDLTGARNRDPLVTSHQRSDSQESAGYQSSENNIQLITYRTSDEVESPSPVQLESPPDYGFQPAESKGMFNTSNSKKIQTFDLEPKTLERQLAGQPLHVSESELAALERPNIIAPGNAGKQPEQVLIYEDPISPAIDQQEDHIENITNDHHSYQMPCAAMEQQIDSQQNPTTPVKQHGRGRSLDAPLGQGITSGPAIGSGSISFNPNIGFTDLGPHSGPDTPVTARKVGVYASEPPNSSESLNLGSPQPKASNNENTTPNLSKFALNVTGRPSSKHNTALEELPSDEPDHRDNTPILHVDKTRIPSGATISVEEASKRRWMKFEKFQRRRSISPRSRDPVKARDMLEKGIQRIRSGTMDIVGYRKLQGLIEFHDVIFTDEAKYDEMLVALLEELQNPIDSKKQQFGRPLDLKTQVLLTIRYMLAHNKEYFAAYYPKAILALIGARKHYSSHSHILSGMEETMNEIIEECEPREVIEAVVDMLFNEEEETEEGNRATEMGIDVLTRILRRLTESNMSLPEHQMKRIGALAAKTFTNHHPDVRKQVTQLGVKLHSMATNENNFWEILGWPQASTRNLLTYYIVRG